MMTNKEAVEKLRENFCKLKLFCELYPDACQKEDCDIYLAIEVLKGKDTVSPSIDTISRQAAIDAIRKDVMGGLNYESILKRLPSAQPSLYGYKIEHLAYIARVMEKEGVTADYAVRTFDDMSRAIKMIIDEAQQKVEESLQLFEPYNKK